MARKMTNNLERYNRAKKRAKSIGDLYFNKYYNGAIIDVKHLLRNNGSSTPYSDLGKRIGNIFDKTHSNKVDSFYRYMDDLSNMARADILNKDKENKAMQNLRHFVDKRQLAVPGSFSNRGSSFSETPLNGASQSAAKAVAGGKKLSKGRLAAAIGIPAAAAAGAGIGYGLYRRNKKKKQEEENMNKTAYDYIDMIEKVAESDREREIQKKIDQLDEDLPRYVKKGFIYGSIPGAIAGTLGGYANAKAHNRFIQELREDSKRNDEWFSKKTHEAHEKFKRNKQKSQNSWFNSGQKMRDEYNKDAQKMRDAFSENSKKMSDDFEKNRQKMRDDYSSIFDDYSSIFDNFNSKQGASIESGLSKVSSLLDDEVNPAGFALSSGLVSGLTCGGIGGLIGLGVNKYKKSQLKKDLRNAQLMSAIKNSRKQEEENMNKSAYDYIDMIEKVATSAYERELQEKIDQLDETLGKSTAKGALTGAAIGGLVNGIGGYGLKKGMDDIGMSFMFGPYADDTPARYAIKSGISGAIVPGAIGALVGRRSNRKRRNKLEDSLNDVKLSRLESEDE